MLLKNATIDQLTEELESRKKRTSGFHQIDSLSVLAHYLIESDSNDSHGYRLANFGKSEADSGIGVSDKQVGGCQAMLTQALVDKLLDKKYITINNYGVPLLTYEGLLGLRWIIAKRWIDAAEYAKIYLES